MSEVSDNLWYAGCTTGGLVRTCEKHKVTFFDDDETGGWEDGELEALREKAKSDPGNYVACDGVHSTDLFGVEWVWNCERCQEELLKRQRFLWDYRHSILSFLKKELEAQADEAKQLLEGIE